MSGPPRKLPLTALRTFEAAARRLSFKEAADELCVSTTTVSNQIRQLEADWNCKLFIRKTRAVVLTDEGRSLSRVVTRAFDEIRSEVERQKNPARRSVTLAVGPIFGSRWLVPRLARFREQHPRIDLVLHESPRFTDAAMMSTHLAVDWGTGDWSGLDCRKLFAGTYAPVVRGDLMQACGGLSEPADVNRFAVIHKGDKPERAAWMKQAGHPALAPCSETTIIDSNQALQAALDGQGICLGVFPFVQADVDSGRLVKPFDIDMQPERAFHLLSRPSGARTREGSAVRDWLLAEAGVSPG
ncbi:MAG: LysR substrate-binding domain-containing protein [Rhodobacteraceae bacterium]|nr:LysR substrate-binding domain-containing protein [Paracoccaceae bacterium]